VLSADGAKWVSVHKRYKRYGVPARTERIIDHEPFNCPGPGALGPVLAILFGKFPKHARPFGIFCLCTIELVLPSNLGYGPKRFRVA
jgi:hypothetical protein